MIDYAEQWRTSEHFTWMLDQTREQEYHRKMRL
mgnify:CR=1 FL=1